MKIVVPIVGQCRLPCSYGWMLRIEVTGVTHPREICYSKETTTERRPRIESSWSHLITSSYRLVSFGQNYWWVVCGVLPSRDLHERFAVSTSPCHHHVDVGSCGQFGDFKVGVNPSPWWERFPPNTPVWVRTIMYCSPTQLQSQLQRLRMFPLKSVGETINTVIVSFQHRNYSVAFPVATKGL